MDGGVNVIKAAFQFVIDHGTDSVLPGKIQPLDNSISEEDLG